MNFSQFNYVRGCAALASWNKRDYAEAVQAEIALAYRRAESDGCSPETAMSKSFRERIVAQLLCACVVVGLIALTVVLARNDAAPEWALCVLACTPGLLLFGATWLEQRIRRAWGI